MTVHSRLVSLAIFSILALATVNVLLAGSEAANIDQGVGTDTSSKQRQVRVINGNPVARGRYPYVSAILSGRNVSLQIGARQTNAMFFGGGNQIEFSGSVVECGLALGRCAGASGKVCSIVFDFPTEGQRALTPEQQLANCSDAGGVGAIFRPNPSGFSKLNIADTSIPAVYIYNNDGYQKLFQALSSGTVFSVSVATQVPDTILCGGTYLGDVWVLTAAHCIAERIDDGIRLMDPQELLVDVGAYRLGDETQYVQNVVEIITNNYRTDGPWGKNDYALLRLDAPPRRGMPVGLVSREQLDLMAVAAEDALVIGWGSTAIREPLTQLQLANSTSIIPRAATLKLYSVDACRGLWRDFFMLNNLDTTGLEINNNHICAADFELQKDTCQGDSGGPLLVNVEGEMKLAGITSFGLGCGSSNGVPGVYSSTSNISSWLQTNTGLPLFVSTERSNQIPEDSVTVASGGGAFAFWSLLYMLMLYLVVVLRKPGTVLKVALIVGLTSIAAGCNGENLPASSAAGGQLDIVRAEQLDATYSHDTISARVLSSGCTTVENFSVTHESQGNVCTVTITRDTPDLCKRMTAVIDLHIDWPLPEECSAQAVKFSNPPLSED